MAKYKVSYDRTICMGDFNCSEAAPQFWVYNKDGKADLKGSSYNKESKKWEMLISEADYDDMQAAAESCAYNAISIEKISDDISEGLGDWKEETPKKFQPIVKEPNCPVKPW
jgi:ferredoxin